MADSMLIPAKITYVVDREKFDAVVDLGFKVTLLVRCKLKGMPQVAHEHYREVKRLLSSKIHRHDVYIRTFKSDYYGIYETEIYALPKGETSFDIARHSLGDLEFLNAEIISEIEQVIKKKASNKVEPESSYEKV